MEDELKQAKTNYEKLANDHKKKREKVEELEEKIKKLEKQKENENAIASKMQQFEKKQADLKENFNTK